MSFKAIFYNATLYIDQVGKNYDLWTISSIMTYGHFASRNKKIKTVGSIQKRKWRKKPWPTYHTFLFVFPFFQWQERKERQQHGSSARGLVAPRAACSTKCPAGDGTRSVLLMRPWPPSSSLCSADSPLQSPLSTRRLIHPALPSSRSVASPTSMLQRLMWYTTSSFLKCMTPLTFYITFDHIHIYIYNSVNGRPLSSD